MNLDAYPVTLTVEQAAAILGISRALAYNLARDGGIPTVRRTRCSSIWKQQRSCGVTRSRSLMRLTRCRRMGALPSRSLFRRAPRTYAVIGCRTRTAEDDR